MNFKKKAVGDVISSLILFISIISITTIVVVFFQNYMADTQDSLNKKKETTTGRLDTDISFININYENDETEIYIKNIGDIEIETAYLEIFLDDEYITSFDVLDATNNINSVDIIDIQEVVLIRIQKTLSSKTHSVSISSKYGNVFEEDFNT